MVRRKTSVRSFQLKVKNVHFSHNCPVLSSSPTHFSQFSKMSSLRKLNKTASPKSKRLSKLKDSPSTNGLNDGDDHNSNAGSNDSNSDCSIVPRKPKSTQSINMDLKKEYARYCKLYSSEPMDFVSSPLEQATLCQGTGQPSGVGGVSVDLKGRGLRGVDCIAVGKILASNASIQHLNLSDCLLLPQGFQAILDGAAKNTTLELLELRGNNIQSVNMLEPLGAMLKINNRLKRLVLEWNHIGCNKEAFQYLCDGISANCGLELLDIRNNQISDECTLDLAGALKNNKTLKDIDLRWNSIGVKGARALYDLLSANTTLVHVQLGGNFVPEEIVQHIDQMLKQRFKQDEMVKDYSTRTTILTRQLQKTEEEYQNEIKKIMNVFDAEEKEYRKIIEENDNLILTINKDLKEEISKNADLQKEIEDLNKKLAEASITEIKLQSIITEKDQRLTDIENAYKSQTGCIETNFTKKVKDLQEMTDNLSHEKTNLMTTLKTTEAELQVKTAEVAQLKETIQALIKSSDQLQEQFDERLRQAKASWTGFQTEVESAERKEIQRLENQMNEMNTSLMDHLKVLENKKADAEEEVRRLKILLVTSKSETEEELTKLRVHLAEEYNASVKSHMDQISNLRQENEKFEVEVNKLESQVHKMEAEIGKTSRQNDHLKQQLAQANEDLSEVHANSQTMVSRTKNELKDTLERLSKEEESNRLVRSQLHDLQQQVASLSVKVSKLTQEKQADLEFWKLQIQRREDELSRLKSEDMRRAALLHEAFSVYMRSTAVATGLPIPTFCSETSTRPNIKPENSSTHQQPNKIVTDEDKEQIKELVQKLEIPHSSQMN